MSGDPLDLGADWPGKGVGSSQPETSILADFERRQTDQREDQRDDPKPDHNLRLGPALFLKMVVDRSHQENALTGALEVEHLDDDRQGLNHEQTTNHRPNQLMLGDNGDGSQRATKGQRACVAHEHGGRRGVVPQKPKAPANQSGGKNQQLARARHVMHIKV